MARYALIIEYEGSGYEGWQAQRSGLTVQDHVQDALATSLRTPTSVTGSGRTDSGVHARFQVAHFDSDDVIEPTRLFKSLNGLLPGSIAVRAVVPVVPDFHARYDAIRRTYRYYVSTAPSALSERTRHWIPSRISFEAMQKACLHLMGEHDFSAFCRTQSETKNRVCSVESAAWVAENRLDFFFEVTANRFLHGMVRAIVGTMFDIGTGKREVDDIDAIIKSKDRRKAGPAADPRGLVLYQVDYPDGTLPFIL